MTPFRGRALMVRRLRGAGWACFAFTALVGALMLAACTRPSGDFRAEHPWVRWLPAGLPAAGYMTLVNPSARDRFVVGATSPDYGSVALHQSYTLPSGAEGMRPVPRLRIPARGEVKLGPGGYHLMLMDPHRNLAPGETVTLILHLADGESLSVHVPVRPATAGNG